MTEHDRVFADTESGIELKHLTCRCLRPFILTHQNQCCRLQELRDSERRIAFRGAQRGIERLSIPLRLQVRQSESVIGQEVHRIERAQPNCLLRARNCEFRFAHPSKRGSTARKSENAGAAQRESAVEEIKRGPAVLIVEPHDETGHGECGRIVGSVAHSRAGMPKRGGAVPFVKRAAAISTIITPGQSTVRAGVAGFELERTFEKWDRWCGALRHHAGHEGESTEEKVVGIEAIGTLALDAFGLRAPHARAALASKVIAKGFFWMGERGDKASKRKSGIENLAAAIGLDRQDGEGWETLAAAANEATLEPIPERKGVMCSPAAPVFDHTAAAQAAKATGTQPEEWGFPVKGSLDVHAAGHINSPVIEKIGSVLVRIMPGEPLPGAGDAPLPQLGSYFVRIVTPSGQLGYVSDDTISTLDNDQLCFVKDANGWKITGYVDD
jgi:hypothetical protein